MANPLVLPADPAQLEQDVAGAWQDAARAHGVDPQVAPVHVNPNGRLWSSAPVAVSAALSHLADILEDSFYVVDRTAGLRVVGQAVAPGFNWDTGQRAVPLRSLPPSDPRVESYRSALWERRQAGQASGSEPGAKDRGRMALERMRGAGR